MFGRSGIARSIGSGSVAPGSDERVIAVVVTYRRDDLLRACVEAILGQTRPPELVLVVDNDAMARASLGERERLEILEPGENLGPAGGYALGFREALTRGATHVWAVDDDNEPARDCLERLVGARAEVAVPFQRKPSGPVGYPPSWNGPLFAAGAIRAVGFPREDLWYWAEDTEYATRLRLAGRRRTPVPDAEILHRNPAARTPGAPRGWELYYEVRNTLEYRLRIRRPTPRALWRAASVVVGKPVAILLTEPRKLRSLSLWWRGVRDFLGHRMGRRVDPETWDA
jgi:GT2 family glycosyltransferase